jgi:tetratricopeptide (TPR) repeat protein
MSRFRLAQWGYEKMPLVKRAAALVALIAAVAAGVLVIQRIYRDREYRHLLEEGERSLQAGDTNAAVEAFTGALTLRPDSMVAFFHRGQAYRAERRDLEASRDLRRAARMAPNAAQPPEELAELYEAAGDAAQAAYWYGQAVQIKPGDVVLLYKLALARYRAGSPAEAIEPLREAIAQNDSLGEAQYLLGLAYRDTQRQADAAAALERAVKVAPSLNAAREELADLYGASGHPVDQMEQLQKLAVLDERTDRAIAIGTAQLRQGQLAVAIGTLGDAARRSPADSSALLELGRAYVVRAERSGDRSAVWPAFGILDRALAAGAPRSEALALKGRAWFLSGDPVRAQKVLQEASTTSPVSPEAFAYLADACERLGHLVDARDALVTLDLLTGDTASPSSRGPRLVRMGGLALRAGDATAAARDLSDAIATGARDATTWALLAEARWTIKDVDGARAALDSGLAVSARDPDLVRLKRLIR